MPKDDNFDEAEKARKDGDEDKENKLPVQFKAGDQCLQIAKDTPPWPVKVVGARDSK
jgi:hypothetical protein